MEIQRLNKQAVNDAATKESKDTLNMTDRSSTQNKRATILVIVNPHSGRGKSLTIYRKKLMPFLQLHNIEHDVFISDTDLRVHDLLIDKNIHDIISLKSIVIVSGDGMFHEAINALRSRPDWEKAITVPLGIVPTGSGNGLAYTLINRSFPDAKSKNDVLRICCEQIALGETCSSDLVKITYGANKTIWSFLSIGWGLIADIDIDSEWLRRLGEIRFTIYALLRCITSVTYRGKLSYKPADQPETVSMADTNSTSKLSTGSTSKVESSDSSSETLDDRRWVHIDDQFVCLYAVYQTYISKDAKFSPKSTMTDQLIYLTYIRGKLNHSKIMEFLLSIKDGSHDKLPYVTVVPVKCFKFQPLDASKIVVDGEVIPWHLSDGQISAEVVPKAIKLLWKAQAE